MTRVVVAGIDLSLASTGLALATWHDGVREQDIQRIQSKGQAGATLTQRRDRLHRLCAAISDRAGCADLVVIEGPSYGTSREQAAARHDRSGLWWLLVDNLVETFGSRVAEVPPSVRAKYATGVGNAGKDAVLAAAVKRYPDWDITGNDVADAVILAAMGARHLGHPIDSLPQVHLAAMTKVRWPATDSGGNPA